MTTLDEFDTLVCFETLEHLRAPARFLLRLAPSVTTIIASVPVIPTVGENPFHHHDFTLKSFHEMLSTAGFTVVESTYDSAPYRRHVNAVVLAKRQVS